MRNTISLPSRSALWLTLILITGVSVLVAGCGSHTHPSFASSPPPTVVSATSTSTPDLFDPLRYEKQEIAQLRERLQEPDLDPVVRESLEDTLEIIEGDVQRMESTRNRPPDWQAPTNTPRTPIPTRPRPTGIVERFNHPPLYPNDTTFTNGWQEKINGKWVQVFAGVPASDPTQGFLFVQGCEKGGEYPTPSQVGAVTITSYKGTVLILTSADGTTFLFDVATGTFVGE